MDKILVADDDRAIRQSIRLILTDQPYQITECGELDQVYNQILNTQPDLILLDVHFKDQTSVDLMRTLAKENHQIPVIILSGAATATEAADLIKLGAYDYIEKPLSAERLRLTIERGLENSKLRHKLQGINVAGRWGTQVTGRSAEAEKLRRQIEQFGPKDVRILITGETGTGKEVVAQNLWRASGRSDHPLLVVNSAAIPESLLESELFGHKKGSFTGAIADQVGKIEMADRGTLFLDEIGDLSTSAQTKLLRFLETGEIQKVGSNHSKTVDVRLIAATSRDLEKDMDKGSFRADLYYRLNVVRLTLAPLRERKEDIIPLFNEFITQFCQKFKEVPKTLSPDAADALESHSWPGNVRELRNVAERVVLSSEQRIVKEHIVAVLGPQSERRGALRVQSAEEVLPLKEFKRRMERQYIQSVLALTEGSITKAAQLLKIDRTYLHQKLAQLNKED